jgi:hypothetical protein
VLQGEPDWSSFPAGVPPRLRALVARCLRRDPRRRWQDMGDVRIELEDIAAPGEPPSAPPRPTRRRALLALGGAGLGVTAFAAGRWWPRPAAGPAAPAAPAPEWAGDLILSGSFPPGLAVSPDGQSLAFLQLVDRLPQVAVLTLATGERRVLTTDRARGRAQGVSWSRDGGRIYFHRWGGGPTTDVYRVSVLSGAAELVLEGAGFPRPLSDGSLLVSRGDADGALRLVRYWPDRGRAEPLPPPLAARGSYPPFLPFPDGREVLYQQRPTADVPLGTLPRWGVLDLAAGRTRPFDLPIASRDEFVTDLATDGQTVYVGAHAARGLARIVALPAEGGGRPHTVLTFTEPVVCGLSTGPDGNVYAAVESRGVELLRFSTGGGNPERLARSEFHREVPLVLPDGRILFGKVDAGRHRVVVVTPGREGEPFVQTDEETWPPAAVLDGRRVALWVGRRGRFDLVVVPVTGGPILERYEVGAGDPGETLAALPGGGTLYSASFRRAALALDLATRRVRAVGPWVAAAPAPDGRSLYVAVPEGSAALTARLERRPPEGEAGEPVPLRGDLRLHRQVPFTGAATGPDGRLAVQVTARDDYFNIPAVLDPTSGEVQPIRLDYEGDIAYPTWAGDGRLLAQGRPRQVAVWRFRPQPAGGAP